MVLVWTIINALILLLPILLGIIFYILSERKIMASVQRRLGPSYIDYFGILQPLADALKALAKETIVPRRADKFLFILAPLLSFGISFFNWMLIPFTNTVSETIGNLNFPLFFILALSSLNVYGIILSGWSSNSRYAFLGAIRSVSQMLSYEISLSFIILPILFITGSLNFFDIVYFQQKAVWLVFPLLPLFIIFFISSLAETNRAPFDLPEAEAEIVAGYNIEYSGFLFALFFLAEYSNMILMSALNVILFFGGWDGGFLSDILSESFIFASKTIIFCFMFILVRATLPRYRFDQLMSLCWTKFLPFTMFYSLFIITFLFITVINKYIKTVYTFIRNT